jgi:hypothetical protein
MNLVLSTRGLFKRPGLFFSLRLPVSLHLASPALFRYDGPWRRRGADRSNRHRRVEVWENDSVGRARKPAQRWLIFIAVFF